MYRTVTCRKKLLILGLCRCFSWFLCNESEQKARVTYDNILRLSDDPDVNDVIKFLREREVVHFQRFGEAMQLLRRLEEHPDAAAQLEEIQELLRRSL
mgnify:CR=1 FL=1